jgi:DNA-binding transcriptional ArsR family regulator
VIYWKLRDLERQGRNRQTILGLAERLLGVSRPTVANAFKKLKELGLADYHQDGNRIIFSIHLPNGAKKWFVMNAPKPRDKPEPTDGATNPGGEHGIVGSCDDPLSPFSAEFVAAGLDRKRAVELSEWYHDIDLVPSSDWFDQMKDDAKREHRENGTAPPEQWGALFYWKIRQVVEKRKPRVEFKARRQQAELVEIESKLAVVRKVGYRCVRQEEICCLGNFPMVVRAAGAWVFSSAEIRSLCALLKPMVAEEMFGQLICRGCGEVVGVERWFEVSQGQDRYFLIPPKSPDGPGR